MPNVGGPKHNITHIIRDGKRTQVYRCLTRDERIARDKQLEVERLAREHNRAEYKRRERTFPTAQPSKFIGFKVKSKLPLQDIPTHKLDIACNAAHRAEWERRNAAAANPTPETLTAQASDAERHATAVAAFDARMAAIKARRINHKN